MTGAPAPPEPSATQPCPTCGISRSTTFNLIPTVLAPSLNRPSLFVKFGREVSFTQKRVCPLWPAKTEPEVYWTGLSPGFSTSQLAFSLGTWLRSTWEPGCGGIRAFLWGFSVVLFETDIMKFGGNPCEENGLQPAEMGQLLGLSAAEAKATERNAKAFARQCPAIHCPAGGSDFGCSQVGRQNPCWWG